MDIYRIAEAKRLLDNIKAVIDLFDIVFWAKDINNSTQFYYTDKAKIELLNQLKPTFEDGISIAVELYELTNDINYLYKAFWYREKSKGVVILAHLQHEYAKVEGKLPKQYLEEEENRLLQITKLDSQINDLDNPNNTEDEKNLISILKQQRATLYKEYNDFLNKLEEEYLSYKYYKDSIRIADIETIQQKLKEQNACLISFFFGKTNLYSFTLTPISISVKVIPQNKDLLNNQIAKLKAELLLLNVHIKTYITKVYDFYKTYIEPVLPNEKYNKLILVSDKDVARIPIEMLCTTPYDAQQSFADLTLLLHRFESITYQYSASVWCKFVQKLASPFNKKILAIAPIRQVILANNTYEALIYSENEVRSIESIACENKIPYDILIGTDATKTNFKQKCPNSAIIHIAAHHQYKSKEENHLSGIVFSPEAPMPRTEYASNSLLYIHETYSLPMDNTDLVVLSCCSTGEGAETVEGNLAVNRGILHAGANNVIFTLWSIEDKTAAEFMSVFYKNLFDDILSHDSYSVALSKTKIYFCSQNYHPRYWAGFVIIGQ